jgi:uncharacterized membrane protein
VIRTGLLWLITLFYAAAGYAHLANPAPFLLITPPWVPAPEAVVALTGLAELAGAAALLQPWSAPLRRAAGWSLAAYALCVWPANFQHLLLDLDRADGGAGLGYHVPRLAFQPVLIWLALWVSHATDWPFAKQGSKAGA